MHFFLLLIIQFYARVSNSAQIHIDSYDLLLLCIGTKRQSNVLFRVSLVSF